MNEDDEVKSIAQDIAEYLRLRPGSSDSFEGVACWWLPQQIIKKNLSSLRKALEYLAEEGQIVKSKDSKGETIYRSFPCNHNNQD